MEQMETMYQVYCTDMMGTTTPKSHIGEMKEYLLRSEVSAEVSRITGIENIEEAVDNGLAQLKQGNKDHKDFKTFLDLNDVGAAIGYKKGELSMPVDDDAQEALETISAAGGRIIVYSSGGLDSLEAGMKGNGLDNMIERYHSSSQPEIGSKFKAHAYQEIARQAGVDVSEMVYVTDDKKEADGAVAAGCGRVYFLDRNAEGITQEKGYTVINDYRIVAEQTLQPDRKAYNTTSEAEASE